MALIEQVGPSIELNVQNREKGTDVITLECPISHNLAEVNEWKQVLIANEPGTWWHCPECFGWHIALRKR